MNATNREQRSQQPRKGGWLCRSCREGIQLTLASAEELINDERSRASEPGARGLEPVYFFPDPSFNDEPLQEPPLPMKLFAEELQTILDADHDSAVAATFFGPPQDKRSNEDFALTAVFRDAREERWTFAVVADGVSTKTFWPARTSRISCLTALLEIRKFIRGCQGEISEEALHKLRQTLAEALRYWLAKDRTVLLEESDLHPAGWDENLYRQLGRRSEYWYNSTLLVACLGPHSGFLLWAGDGGIRIIKTPGQTVCGDDTEIRGEESVPLESTDDMTIGTFVSLEVTSSHFRAARISFPPLGGQVQVYLASDGVDRTLQRISKPYRELELDSSRRAREQLQQLSNLPGCEQDNYSIAWISSLRTGSPGKPELREEPSASPPVSQEVADNEGPLMWNEPENQRPVQEVELSENSTNTKLAFSLSSLRGMIFLCLVFLAGLTAGLLLHPVFSYSKDKEKKQAVMAAAPPLAEPPAPPPVVLPPPKPIEIVKRDKKALSRSLLTPQLAGGLADWIRFLRADRSSSYSVLVYRNGVEAAPRSSKACRRLGEAAKATAQLVLAALQPMVQDRGSFRIKVHQQVCSPPPPGLVKEGSTAAALLLLQTGEGTDCDCEQIGGSS